MKVKLVWLAQAHPLAFAKCQLDIIFRQNDDIVIVIVFVIVTIIVWLAQAHPLAFAKCQLDSILRQNDDVGATQMPAVRKGHLHHDPSVQLLFHPFSSICTSIYDYV